MKIGLEIFVNGNAYYINIDSSFNLSDHSMGELCHCLFVIHIIPINIIFLVFFIGIFIACVAQNMMAAEILFVLIRGHLHTITTISGCCARVEILITEALRRP